MKLAIFLLINKLKHTICNNILSYYFYLLHHKINISKIIKFVYNLNDDMISFKILYKLIFVNCKLQKGNYALNYAILILLYHTNIIKKIKEFSI